MSKSTGSVYSTAISMLFAVAMNGSMAQGYPAKPIHIVIPFSAGTQVDLPVRLIGDSIQARLGQSVIPDFRPGAGGMVAHEFVARQAPDGYTVLFTGTLPTYPVFYKQVNFDPVASFTPIAMVGTAIVVLFAPGPDRFPPKNIAETIAYAKANPGKLNYGDVAALTTGGLIINLLERGYGISLTKIVYKGSNDVITDLVRGDIHLAFLGLAGREGLAKEGKIRMFAVRGKRSAAIPNVPTLEEAGVSVLGDVPPSWFGIVGPPGMPPAIVARLNAETNRVVTSREFADKNLPNGIEPSEMTPEQLGKRIVSDLKFWTELAKQVNLKPIDP